MMNNRTAAPLVNGSAVAAGGDKRLRRHIGMVGLLFTAVGSIIGSGWLFGALFASELAGPASILSWIIGAIMIMFIGLVFAELGTMFPVSGGVARYPHFVYGSFASFTLGWVTWLACASIIPVEVEAALQYANNYLPFLEHLKSGVPVLTPIGFVVACLLVTVFAIVNFFGIKWFARLNNAAVWWKLAIVTITIVALFVGGTFHRTAFTAQEGGFAPMGFSGVFTAIATAGVVFSYFGFRQGVELAGETSNPQRNVPIAIVGSLVLCALIYVALQIAFIGALPDAALVNGWAHLGTTFKGGVSDQAMAFGPMAALAATLGFSWLMLILYIDAFVSPADTGFIYVTVTSRIAYAMGRNKNAPQGLQRVSKKYGVPWISVILSAIVAMIFFLPFPGWQKLIGFVTSATVLSFGSGPVVMMALRRELPNHKRPFRLRGGWIIPYLAFLSSNLIVFWSGWDVVWKLMLAVVLGLILFGVHEYLYHARTPAVDFRHGFWILPWFSGLTVICWVGSFPSLSHHAGNLGLLGIGTAALVMAVFSALIMWLAHTSRFDQPRILEHLNAWTELAAAEASKQQNTVATLASLREASPERPASR